MLFMIDRKLYLQLNITRKLCVRELVHNNWDEYDKSFKSISLAKQNLTFRENGSNWLQY